MPWHRELGKPASVRPGSTLRLVPEGRWSCRSDAHFGSAAGIEQPPEADRPQREEQRREVKSENDETKDPTPGPSAFDTDNRRLWNNRHTQAKKDDQAQQISSRGCGGRIGGACEQIEREQYRYDNIQDGAYPKARNGHTKAMVHKFLLAPDAGSRCHLAAIGLHPYAPLRAVASTTCLTFTA